MAMRQLWLVAIGYSAGAKISSIKDFRVCSAHFSEADYIPNQGGKSKKRILKSSAVPVPWGVLEVEVGIRGRYDERINEQPHENTCANALAVLRQKDN
ncbi:THAP domain-containing 4-like isoform X3 [Labeo rohita]|uniref:THAP domain-containing 4-like isoform X3 n=1 Tax=Labeo rohita TaxID=84645 RepID=A0A498N707_LABRO|nr:THAP domain-containing 4-like isoform X3 [Labeo rohita]